MDPAQLIQYGLAGLTLGSIYALVGFSVALIHRASGILNLAQGEFSMVGAMIVIWLTTSLHLPTPVALVIGLLAGVAAGLLLERTVIRPALQFPTLTVVMVTVGAAMTMQGFVVLVWGPDSFTLAPFSGSTPVQIFGAFITTQAFWILGVSVILSALFWYFFEKTTLGIAMRASAENRLGASLVGIEGQRMTVVAFGVAGGVAAVAGILVAPIVFANFLMGMMLTVKGSIAAVVGGINSNVGVIAGGLVIGLLESYSAGLIPSLYKDVVAVLLLIILLCARPNGLIGERG
ncbi:MAG: branched-chain amino acid ABC transporter permease [Chloroflexi bacterium]|nr:branched-chain amino acid ABC transporter permease [Chloroflexota bacterium]